MGHFKEMYIIVDWQNEEDITVLKADDGRTIRFERLEDATEAMVVESNRKANIYLMIVKL